MNNNINSIVNAEEAILTHIEELLLDNDNVPKTRTIEYHRQQPETESVIWAVSNVDPSKLSGKARRINVTIPENLLSKIDSFAEKEGETRSGFLVSAAMEYISNHN